MREGPIHCILARNEDDAWSLVLAQPGEGLIAQVSPEDGEALAGELVQMAELARRPGGVVE